MRGLRKEGYGEICLDEPATEDEHATQGGVAAFLILGSSPGLYVADSYGFSPLGWFAAVALSLLVAFVVMVLTRKRPGLGILLLLTAWVGTGIGQILSAGLGSLALTHGGPLAMVGGAYWLSRGRRFAGLAAGLPLLFPIAVALLFVPVLTADLWRAAEDLPWSGFLFLGLITIAPLSLVLRRQLHRSVEQVFATAAAKLERRADPAQGTLKRLRKLLGADAASAVEHGGYANVEEAFADGRPSEYAPMIAAIVGKPFRGQVTWRFVPMIAGFLAVLSAYFYALAWAVVTVGTAARWTGEGIRSQEVSILGLGAHLPCGPYPKVALLLGIVATAIFLAFVLTEDRYSTALAEALVEDPVEHCLVLAVPFSHVREQEDSLIAEHQHVGATPPAADTEEGPDANSPPRGSGGGPRQP